MTLMAQFAQGTIHASHHNFVLIETDTPGPTRTHADRSNGLIDPQPGGVALVFTGVHTGEVNVTVDVRDDAPPVNTEDWEEVVEVSLEAPNGDLWLAGPAAETPSQQLYPLLTPHGPGHYRIRVHARGRDGDQELDAGHSWDEADGARDEEEEEDLDNVEPTEHYLIITWPSEPAPQTIYKWTDKYGATLRERATRRRSH